MTKKFFVLIPFVAGIMIMFGAAVFAADMKVIVDGEEIRFEETLPVIDNTTYVPLRSVLEKCGVTVTWNETDKTVLGAKGEVEIIFSQDETWYQQYIIRDGKTYVMLRAVELFGCGVKYDFNTGITYVAANRPFPEVTSNVLNKQVLAGEWLSNALNSYVFFENAVVCSGIFETDTTSYSTSGNTLTLYGIEYVWNPGKPNELVPTDETNDTLYKNSGRPMTLADITGTYSIFSPTWYDEYDNPVVTLNADKTATLTAGGETLNGTYKIISYRGNTCAEIETSFNKSGEPFTFRVYDDGYNKFSF